MLFFLGCSSYSRAWCGYFHYCHVGFLIYFEWYIRHHHRRHMMSGCRYAKKNAWKCSFINKWQVNRPRKEVSWVLDMCIVQFSQYTELQLMHFLCCIINHALHRLFMYDPFISALLRGLLSSLISKKILAPFWGCHDSVVCASAHFGEYLSLMGRFRMFGWQASFVPEKNQWRSGRVPPVVCGVAGRSLDSFHGYFFPFYQENGAYKCFRF